MHICPAVRERCCSLMDEIRILQFWNKYTWTVLENKSTQLFWIYETALEFHQHFAALDPEDIIIHYFKKSRDHVPQKVCLKNSIFLPFKNSELKKIAEKSIPGKGLVKKNINNNKPITKPEISTMQGILSQKEEIQNFFELM